MPATPSALVCYVGPVMPLRGGIAQHGDRLVRALRGTGASVRVVSWAAQYPRLLYKGTERDPALAATPSATFTMRWWNPASWWRAGRAARSSAVLVFPFHTPLQAPMYWAVVTAAHGTTVVCIAHNPRPHEHRPFDRALTRMLFKRVHGAVVHAKQLVTDMAELAPEVRVQVVAHPPNLPLAPSPLPPAPPYRLLFFGFVRPYKGLDIAVDAVRLLRDRGVPVELTVRGEFWEPVKSWRRRIVQRGLADVLRLEPGYVSDDEVGALFDQHHLILAPYRSATQSGIVPLAFGAGRAVVATAVGGLADVVTEGRTGTIARQTDPVAFADAIERAIDDLGPLTEGAAKSAPSWESVAAAVLRAADVTPSRAVLDLPV